MAALEAHLDGIKAAYALNADKLDYNYRVLGALWWAGPPRLTRARWAKALGASPACRNILPTLVVRLQVCIWCLRASTPAKCQGDVALLLPSSHPQWSGRRSPRKRWRSRSARSLGSGRC